MRILQQRLPRINHCFWSGVLIILPFRKKLPLREQHQYELTVRYLNRILGGVLEEFLKENI